MSGHAQTTNTATVSNAPILIASTAAKALHPYIERLALLGWRLYPSSRDRKGMFKGYIDAATSNLTTLSGWSADYPGCNWAVIPGGSGIWALDVDALSPDHTADGIAELRALCAEYGPLPAGPRGRSGGGGHLLVFRDTGHPIRGKTGTPAPGIDPRVGRVSFTVAPSVHRRGGQYRWVVSPWELAPPAAPDWLLRLLAPPTLPMAPSRALPRMDNHAARRILKRALQAVQDAQRGQRNATLNQNAFTIGGLIGAGMIDELLAVIELYSAGRFAGLDDAETKATIRSGVEAGMRRPLNFASHD